MPMLIDLNSEKFRDPWRPASLALGILYFFAFGGRLPRFYKVGLVHQSRDWRNLWFMLDGRRAAHCRAFRSDTKILLPWSFAFISPSHHWLWYAERRIKQDIRDQKAWARPVGVSGYTETFAAHLMEHVIAVVESAKGEVLTGTAPPRFNLAWPVSAKGLMTKPLAIDQVQTLLTMPASRLPTTVEGFVRAVRDLDRPS